MWTAFLALTATAATLDHEPFEGGKWVEFRIDGLGVGELVELYGTFAGPGPGNCPAELGGACLDIAGPEFWMGELEADVDGIAAARIHVRPIHIGKTLTVQGGNAAQLTDVRSGPVEVRQSAYGLLDAEGADVLFWGANEWDLSGCHVSDAGDVNGDGVDDVIIGARKNGPGDEGAAYVHFGPLIPGSAPVRSADLKLRGEAAGDVFGYRVASAGDVDGDGFDDVLVGAFSEDSGGANAGATYLFAGGQTGIVDAVDALAKLQGEEALDHSGYGLDGAGDVNDDGYADLVIGSYGNDRTGAGAGAAYLIYGPVAGVVDVRDAAYAIFVGEAADDKAGIRVSTAGDQNGDGFADLLIGAHYNDRAGFDAGAAYVMLGPTLGGRYQLADADSIYIGEDTGDYLGLRLSTAGDVDADGLDDLVLGAYEEGASAWDQASVAYVAYGFTPGETDLETYDARLQAEFSLGLRGVEVSDAGDFDGDGFGDILIGAKFQDVAAEDAGAAYLKLGPVYGFVDLETEAELKIMGERGKDFLGYSVSGAGDVNADGLDDLILGAYGANYNALKAGATYVVFGEAF